MATIPINVQVTGTQDLAQLAHSLGLTIGQADLLSQAASRGTAALNQMAGFLKIDATQARQLAQQLGAAASSQNNLTDSVNKTNNALRTQRQQVRDLRNAVYGLAGVAAIFGGIGYGALRMAQSFQKAQIEVDGIDNRLRNLTNRQISIGLRAPGDLGKIRDVADTVTQQAGMPNVGTMREAAVILESYSVKSKDIERLLPLIQRQVETMKSKGLTISPELVAKQLGSGYTDISMGRLKRAGATVNPADEMAVKQAKALGAEAGRAEYMRRVIAALDRNTVSLGASLSEAAKNANRLAVAWQKFQISPMGRGFTSVLFEVYKLITSILETLQKFSQTHPTIARLVGLFFGIVGAVAILITGMLGLVIATGQVLIAVEAVQVAFAAATAEGGMLAGLSFAGLIAGLSGVALMLGGILLTAKAVQMTFQTMDLAEAKGQLEDIPRHPEYTVAQRMQKMAGPLKTLERLGETDAYRDVRNRYDILVASAEGKAAIAKDPSLALPPRATPTAAAAAAFSDANRTKEMAKAENDAKKATDKQAEQAAKENAAILMAGAQERAAQQKEAAREEADRIKEAHREARERDHDDLKQQIMEYEEAHRKTREADLNSARGMLLLRHAGYTLPQILMAQRMEKLVRGAGGGGMTGEDRRHIEMLRERGRWNDIVDRNRERAELQQNLREHGLAAAEATYSARMAGAHGRGAGVTRARAGGAMGAARARYGGGSAQQVGGSQYRNGLIETMVKLVIEDPVAHHARRVRR